MGKVKVRTLGDEKQEKKEKEKAKRGAEAKKLQGESSQSHVAKNEAIKEKIEKPEKKPKTKIQTQKKEKPSKKQHSNNYNTVAKILDKNKKYSLKEALAILPQTKKSQVRRNCRTPYQYY